MLGKQFVLDYVLKRYKAEQNDITFKIYVTDALKALARMNIRYWDIIDTSPKKPERSSEEIINSICAQLEEIGGKEEE